jgi:hypothetical protein
MTPPIRQLLVSHVLVTMSTRALSLSASWPSQHSYPYWHVPVYLCEFLTTETWSGIWITNELEPSMIGEEVTR